jgi:hypothetical protein
MVLGECYFYQIVPTNFANEWLGGIKEESVYYLRQASSACERQEHNTGAHADNDLRTTAEESVLGSFPSASSIHPHTAAMPAGEETQTQKSNPATDS